MEAASCKEWNIMPIMFMSSGDKTRKLLLIHNTLIKKYLRRNKNQFLIIGKYVMVFSIYYNVKSIERSDIAKAYK